MSLAVAFAGGAKQLKNEYMALFINYLCCAWWKYSCQVYEPDFDLRKMHYKWDERCLLVCDYV